jgi:hypothetical protein
MLRAAGLLVLCVVALAGLMLFVGYSSCDSSPVEHSESAQADGSNKDNCPTLYTAFKLGLSHTWGFVHEAHEEVIAVGTIFIATFTIILGLFTVNLAGATDRLVRGAENVAERQLRAYVHNVSGIIRNVAAGQKTWIRIEIKNYGKTPAYNVTHTGQCTLALFPWTGCINPPTAQSVSVMGPGSNAFLVVESPVPLSEDRLAGLKAGQIAIYFEGLITYKDTFDRPHTTRYRLLVGGSRGFPPDEALFTDLHGNDAD